jgi:thiosulfate dehydrogenase [quinone] large subunit
MSTAQQVALVVLRTLVGWHLAYEGFVKLWSPAWSRAGEPLRGFSSAGYLKAASGPFAGIFRALGESPVLPAVDWLVTLGLLFAGLALILGLFTRLGGYVALALLAVFYVSQLPTAGIAQPGREGAYLFVDKNLVEMAAVAVVLAFRTEAIAGLDLLLKRRPGPAREAHAR